MHKQISRVVYYVLISLVKNGCCIIFLYSIFIYLEKGCAKNRSRILNSSMINLV